MNKKNVILINAEKTSQKDVKLDPAGFFIIELDRKEKKIRVEYFSNVYKNNKIVTGSLQKIFIGSKADALCDTIAKKVPFLLHEHYMYLGRELLKAEYALKNKIKYIQGNC